MNDKMLDLRNKENFDRLLNDLSLLMKNLIIEITHDFESKYGKEKLKEYLEWKKYNGDSQQKFIIETIYVLFNRILLLFVCEDKGIIKNDIRKDIKNLRGTKYSIIKNIYSTIKCWYPHLFKNITFDWYEPDNKIILEILNKLEKYDFNTVDRDVLGKLYEQFLSRDERKRLGQFYTPEEVIDYILYKVGYSDDKDILNKKLIDPACGSGGFLVRAVDILITKMSKENYKSNETLSQVQNNIFGFDINPFACHLAETNLIFRIIDLIKDSISENPNFKMSPLHIYNTNSIDKKNTFFSGDYATVSDIKLKRGVFEKGFDFVVGNPPYIEMKIMDNETKQICKKNFPEICKGSFDIFICFIKLGLDLLKSSGHFGYIIPNKFLATKYGSVLRKQISTTMNIKEIVNVSNIEVFRNISVYPIIIIIEKSHNETNKILLKPDVEKLSFLNGNSKSIYINQNIYNLSEDNIFFFLPENGVERNAILKIIGSRSEKLSRFLNVKWTVSFHKAGLRKDFIFKEPNGKLPKKILGGKAFGGNLEVQRYKLKWNKYWIDYDEERAKRLNNQFPQRSLFEQEKIIICQNSKRARATYDNQNYYCKDIFFVGYSTDRAKQMNLDIKCILALLNSKLMSYFYSIIFSGTHVGGGYLHYLPIYLNSLPIMIPTRDKQDRIIKLVNKMLEKNVSEDLFHKIDEEIDKEIYILYNLTKEEIEVIEKIVKNKLEVGN